MLVYDLKLILPWPHQGCRFHDLGYPDRGAIVSIVLISPRHISNHSPTVYRLVTTLKDIQIMQALHDASQPSIVSDHPVLYPVWFA